MSRKTISIALQVMLVCALMFVGTSALAATCASSTACTLNINVPNTALSSYPAGTVFATVQLSLVGSGASAYIDVQVQGQQMPGEPAGTLFLFFGSGGGTAAIAWNVLGDPADYGVTNISNGTFSFPGGSNMDGFGSFQMSIAGPTPPGAQSFLEFHITCSGGCTDVNQVVQPNDKGTDWAIHIAPGNGAPTGYAGDGGTPTPTPEPASLALLGMGLLGTGGWMRRRKK